VEQTLFNWVKAQRQGRFKGPDSKGVSAEQMEISRLRAELARVKNEHGITASMSRKGNCLDNAASETRFTSLKVERFHGKRFVTLRQAKDATLDWLGWYIQTRLHSTLNYVSPLQFELRRAC